MNILMVGDGDTKYGAPHSLLHMATALNRYPENHVSVILNQESRIADELRKNGCTVFITSYTPFYQNFPSKPWRLPVKYVIRGLAYLYGRSTAIKSSREIIEQGHFDIIHGNSSREDYAATLSEYYHIPMIWHIREFGDRDYHCYSYRKDYIQLMNRVATKCVAVSDAVRLHWISKGIDASKIVTIYNGVKEMDYQEHRHDDNPDCRFVMVGSIQETKGQLQAVEAMILAANNNPAQKISLDMIGGGDDLYCRKINRIIAANNMQDRIKMIGYREDVESLLHNYDVGIVNSRDEAFGRVTAEYMMAGLTVIGSDTGANKELIRDGVDGLIYRFGNIEDFAEKIQQVVGDPKKYGGRKTHDYAMSHFSARVNAANINELYKMVLDQVK